MRFGEIYFLLTLPIRLVYSFWVLVCWAWTGDAAHWRMILRGVWR